MSNIGVIYYFGRLNLIASYDDKNKFLLNSLKRQIEICKRDYEWGFFNVKNIEFCEIPFLAGYLVKYKPFKDEEVVDEESRQLTTTTIPNRAIAASQFFLHTKSGLLAYHPVPGKIGQHQFRHIFAELIEAANDHLLVDAEVQFIDEEIKILEAIRSFDKITSLVIELHPSNPSNRHIWERTDQRLKSMRAEKYRQQYYSGEGLHINEESEVYGDILMAGDGYGKATLYGMKDGQEYEASTEQVPLKAKGLKDGEPEDKLGSIFHKIKEIWDRMTD